MKFLVLSCLACVLFLDVYSVSIHTGILKSSTVPSLNSAQDSVFFVPALYLRNTLRNTHDRAVEVGRGMRLRAERRSYRCRLSMARDKYEDSFDEEDELPNPIESSSSLSFYRSDNGTRDSEFRFANRKRDPNPYRDMMEALTPGEMVGQFMAKASPEVQGAVKNTIIGLLGSLRASPAFEASISTTHRALASLMYQLEMTGYMFRNAEYRQALQRSLSAALEPADDDDDDEAAWDRASSGGGRGGGTRQYPTVRGRISVSFGEDSEEVEVDAESYVSELSSELEALKRQLASLQQEKEKERAKDLLSYVQSMEASEMQALTDSVSPQVLDAMKQLVDTVIKGMGSDAEKMDERTEVPASTLAQLCMWQLVVGYNLREMEARESMKNRLVQPGPEPDSENSQD